VSAKHKVVALGDSTTAGTPGFLSPVEAPPEGRGNAESQYSYWMMKAHPEWEVLNKGVRGQRSDQILARFDRDVTAISPEAVIILAGVNDVFQGVSVAFVEENLQEMYRRAKRLSAVVVAATILPYNISGPREVQSMRDINSWIRDTAGAQGLLFCDTRRVVGRPGDPDLLDSTPDGLHPSVDGYRKMGEALASVLEKSMP
jgi:lysophospholipase L1-like esterase